MSGNYLCCFCYLVNINYTLLSILHNSIKLFHSVCHNVISVIIGVELVELGVIQAVGGIFIT